MPHVLHHLERDEIDAALGEQLRELPVRGALARSVRIRARVEIRGQAGERRGDRDVAPARVTGFARGIDRAPIDRGELLAVARGFEDEAARAERVRRDHIGARVDVVGVDRAQQVVVGQGGEAAPRRRVEPHPAPAQLASGAAVEQQRVSGA